MVCVCVPILCTDFRTACNPSARAIVLESAKSGTVDRLCADGLTPGDVASVKTFGLPGN
jgi:hypothetical protein